MDSIQNCTWPYWKFGLKKDDLHMKLHDQFNTFPSAIQDPQAFKNDVLEISHEAATQEEFYRLLGQRKQERLAELNNTLEMAALEIISNPRLISSSQWPQAVQLFRTKSLDSLVRYFATYLLDNNFGLKTAQNDTSPPSSSSWDSHLPLSPGSVAVSDSSVPSICSDDDDDDFDFVSGHTYSDSEPDIDVRMPSSSHVPDDLASRTCSINESAVDCGSIRADEVIGESPSCGDSTSTPQSDGSTTPTQNGELPIIGSDNSDGSTTPQPDAGPGAATTAICGDGGEALTRRRIRSYSPSRPLPLSRLETLSLCHPSSCDPGGAHRHPSGEASGRRNIRSRRRAQRYLGAGNGDVRVPKVLSAVYRSRLRERRTLYG